MTREIDWLRNMKNKRATVSKEVALHQDLSRKEAKETSTTIVERIDNKGSNKKRGFNCIAGMETLKQLVTDGFINVLRNPQKAALYGVTVPNILLYGPAGCGKTFFAERVAEEVGINFMKVSPDDLSSVYIHGTQKKIGEVFKKAQESAPTLLFLDEFDCMVPRRSGDLNRQHQTDEVDEFLTMLNNTAKRGVYIIAATNHPENIDSCVLRTGRIDEKIYVPMPDKEMREKLFRLELDSRPVTDDIDFGLLSTLTNGYNCIDISYIVNSAAREKFNASLVNSSEEFISQKDLENIISTMNPSVSEKDINFFERVRQDFAPKHLRSNKYKIGFR